MNDHFATLVREWSHFGTPLRPSVGDAKIVQRIVAELPTGACVGVLGVTPEIFACEWPTDLTVLAIDHSAAMMRMLWPPKDGPAGARAVLADWTSIPIATATFEAVVGDGCYIVFDYPNGYERLTQEIARVLRPGAKFVIRVFARPEHAESIDDIADAFASGRIDNVNVMKLRLLAALHGVSGSGTGLDEVWRAWNAMPTLPQALIGTRGWTPEEITGIDAYRGKDVRYSLPTLQEFRAIASTHFEEIECAFGSDQLTDRCPTFVFKRRSL
jgi:SAM-dependent methyltransferase